ncbi:MAG: putative drug exporter of the superfamily [Actinomycetota bacterium]|nr:putative drug exporter of the superfamily [Actinomycetota bacterium]
MIRLADFCYRRRRYVLGAWVLVFVAVMIAGGALPAEHRANYQTPGAESGDAYSLLNERFPARKGDSVKLVFAGNIDDPAVQAEVDRVIAQATARPHVTGASSPYSPEGATQIASTRQVAYAEVYFDQTFDKLINSDPKFQAHFLEAVDHGQLENPALQVEVTTFVAEQTLGSEFIGLIFAAFILLLAFGSALAMGLPILTALFGLGIGATLGGIASRFVETPEWAATVATMIGLGVGIDYALFIITRYRQGLATGLSPREANLTAMGTAGRAVLFAGGTVVISLLGMLTMGLSYLNGVAASAVFAVLVMLAASITLLPAILGFVGRNIDKLKVPFTGRSSRQGTNAFWYRWSRVVQRRPWVAFAGGALVLLIITLPVLSLRLGFPDEGNNLPKETSRKAYDLLSSGFGPGFNGPLLMVVDVKDAATGAGAVGRLTAAAQATDGVAFVAPPVFNQAGDTAIINVFPDNKPQDEATAELVHRLRDTVIPATIAGSDATVDVGGFTAISIDQTDYITKRLPIFIGSVVLLSFFLLTTVFRSPLVALKAGVMNLLSIAAAYGVMSYAVQGTWLGNLLNIPETPIPAFVPMIMFAILFGLSMDYEVFLLSRIREEYLRTGDNGVAVADGLAATARVITAAAAIMVFVFGVFIFDPNVFIKQIGLGLTTAVLVDATIVRMVLVPATMELLGNANWWMPRWLDKLLPEVHIEGEASVQAELATLLAGEELTGASR